MRRAARQYSFHPRAPSKTPITSEELRSEVRFWSQRLDVFPKTIRIAKMTRKWGSCSTCGQLTFASDLLEQPEDFRREVIVHELLHLKVPNHGPLFRALLTAYLAAKETVDR